MSDSGALTGRVRTLLVVTTGLVATTILLGVATKAAGAGLACDANWPLCDGGVLNLFPATFPSFFEWIHRVVAMLAGVAILGSAAVAIRTPAIDRRVAAAIVLAAVLTPIQVVLGWRTVATYVPEILELHFWTAIAIFVLVVGSTVVVWATPWRARTAVLAGAGLVPVHAALSPVVIGTYTPVVQTLQYGVVLGLVAAAVVAAVAASRSTDHRLRAGVAVVVMLTAALLVLGRQSVMTLSPTLDLAYLLVAATLFLACVGTAVVVRGHDGAVSPP